VGGWQPERVAGLRMHDGATGPLPAESRTDAPGEPCVLPAWPVLPLELCAARAPSGVRHAGVLCGPDPLDRCLEQVRHAVHRGGARHIVFVDREFCVDARRTRQLSRSMMAAAPGVTWSCRVRADRFDPMMALALANGGCQEVLLVSPAGRDAPASLPMDDPVRSRIESAIDAGRVAGLSVVVEHVIGRPGHTRDVLAAWQRWFRDRQVAVHAHVRTLHAGARGSGAPALDEAARRAGCWDNELRPKDVERAVREVTHRVRLAGLAASA
jgi:hypothetical protein